MSISSDFLYLASSLAVSQQQSWRSL